MSIFQQAKLIYKYQPYFLTLIILNFVSSYHPQKLKTICFQKKHQQTESTGLKMQSQQNYIVRQLLISQIKEFGSKQQMIPFYMSYDFPQKQRGVKGWWEDLINNVIIRKNQIYVTFKDLQTITSINGLKPLPLKQLLKQFKQTYVFVRQEDITQQNKPQKKPKPWYSNILNFAWASNQKDEVDFPFTFNPQEKIISISTKQRKKKQLFGILHKQFEHENSKFMRNFVRQISLELKIDQVSVEILLKQLKAQKQLAIIPDENSGDNVIIYNSDRKKMADENYINIEKIKCSLRGSLQRFDITYEKSTQKIANLRQKAKNAGRNSDKNKARFIVAQMKKQEDHRQKIQVQKQVLQLRINQIQVNQMNKSSLELLKQAQSAYQQVAVDQQKFQEVIQKARQIQMESDQNNRKFQELAASQQIEQEVDDMMKEIQQQMSNRNKKVVEPKTVDVIAGEKLQKQRLVFEKTQPKLNLN